MTQPMDLSIFSVATDRYIEFWTKMVRSYLETNDANIKVQWIVFTNKENEIDSELRSRLGKSLLIVDTPHQVWPFPTLLRYKYLQSVSEKVLGRIIMHLDADMLFQSDLKFEEIEKAIETGGIGLVRHPGYYRPAGIKGLRFYARHPRYCIRDLRYKVRYGGLGTWELSKFSQSYVPRSLRKNYVCGGVWFGKQSEILKLCDILSSRVEKDLSQNIIAIFHDESHLNWYQALNGTILFNPEFCFDPSYIQLNGLKPRILAVNKNAASKWIR